MKVATDYDGITIYTNNHITEELIEKTKELCETNSEVNVSFSVIGRTCHMCLAHELASALGDSYKAKIDYDMYTCKISRKES